MLTILDHFLRATADTGHAVSAVIIPDRFAVLHADVVHGADGATFAAGDTVIGNVKLVCVNKHRIEDIIDDAAAQFIAAGGAGLRENFALLNEILLSLELCDALMTCGSIYRRAGDRNYYAS